MRSEPLSLRFLEDSDPGAVKGAKSREKRFLCPFCGENKARDAAHRCLSVELDGGLWVCHRCGERGKLAEWRDEKPLDARVLRRLRLRRTFSLEGGLSVSRNASTRVNPASATTPKGARSSLQWRRELRFLQPLGETAGASYLRRRGLASDDAIAAGARFSPSWFGGAAVVFPLRDAERNLVAAQGRYLGDGDGKSPKARTAGNKKAGVFATADFHESRKRGAPIVITEAPLDALSIAACGFPALALCGKDGWPEWLPIVCAFHPVALAFDADEAGDAGAEKLARVLAGLGARTFRLRPEGAKDWNEILQRQGREVLSEWLVKSLLVMT